jgi:hypothetical protein
MKTWSVHNAEAFAGSHNDKGRLIFIFDEASGIPDEVWRSVNGAFARKDVEIIFIALGNPTRRSGPFYECFYDIEKRKQWEAIKINIQNVEGSDPTFWEDIIARYGADSDEMRIRVLGEFPNQDIDQFIPQDAIDKAYGRTPDPGSYEYAPIIIGVDPALGGSDKFVIGMRQGVFYQTLGVYSKTSDHLEMANVIADFEDKYKADIVVIDFGGGGVGLKALGVTMGRDWVLVDTSKASVDLECLNTRAYMWKATRQWLIDGGCIPKDPEFALQLACISGFYRDVNYKLTIEGKDKLRKTLGTSTDLADALCLTFCVSPKSKVHSGYEGVRMHTREVKKSGSDYFKKLAKSYRN